jgi:hypothetical protein
LFGYVVCGSCLLKYGIEGKMERSKGREDKEEEDLNNYWITLRKREGAGMGKPRHQKALSGVTRKHCLESPESPVWSHQKALSGELDLEEAMDLSQDNMKCMRLHNTK